MLPGSTDNSLRSAGRPQLVVIHFAVHSAHGNVSGAVHNSARAIDIR